MTPEGRVKVKVRKVLKDLGLYYFSPTTGGYGYSGVPDIVICAKGHFIAVECKAGRGKLTELQRAQLKRIKEAGGLAFVVTDKNVHLFNAFLTRLLIEIT